MGRRCKHSREAEGRRNQARLSYAGASPWPTYANGPCTRLAPGPHSPNNNSHGCLGCKAVSVTSGTSIHRGVLQHGSDRPGETPLTTH